MEMEFWMFYIFLFAGTFWVAGIRGPLMDIARSLRILADKK